MEPIAIYKKPCICTAILFPNVKNIVYQHTLEVKYKSMKLLVNINHNRGRDSNVENVYFKTPNMSEYTNKYESAYELAFDKCTTRIIYDDNKLFIYAINYEI